VAAATGDQLTVTEVAPPTAVTPVGAPTVQPPELDALELDDALEDAPELDVLEALEALEAALLDAVAPLVPELEDAELALLVLLEFVLLEFVLLEVVLLELVLLELELAEALAPPVLADDAWLPPVEVLPEGSAPPVPKPPPLLALEAEAPLLPRAGLPDPHPARPSSATTKKKAALTQGLMRLGRRGAGRLRHAPWIRSARETLVQWQRIGWSSFFHPPWYLRHREDLRFRAHPDSSSRRLRGSLRQVRYDDDRQRRGRLAHQDDQLDHLERRPKVQAGRSAVRRVLRLLQRDVRQRRVHALRRARPELHRRLLHGAHLPERHVRGPVRGHGRGLQALQRLLLQGLQPGKMRHVRPGWRDVRALRRLLLEYVQQGNVRTIVRGRGRDLHVVERLLLQGLQPGQVRPSLRRRWGELCARKRLLLQRMRAGDVRDHGLRGRGAGVRQHATLLSGPFL
jgi:hypothetical protein